MTTLLDRAIALARDLPDKEQDAVAAALLALIEAPGPASNLDHQTRQAIREGLEQARRGDFVPDDDIQALWNRHGV